MEGNLQEEPQCQFSWRFYYMGEIVKATNSKTFVYSYTHAFCENQSLFVFVRIVLLDCPNIFSLAQLDMYKLIRTCLLRFNKAEDSMVNPLITVSHN